MTVSVTVRVLFFGVLRDIAGMKETALEVEPGTSVGAVFDRCAARFPRLLELKSSIVLAANQEFSDGARLVCDGDEIAFLPPVSGGSGSPWTHAIERPEGHFYALTRQPIDAAALVRGMLRGEDGAVVDFEGVVRNNTKGRQTLYLDYECYEAMAIKVMAELGDSIASRYPVGRIAMVHRLGRMEIGETSVAIVVTSPHRKPAFEAALEGIDRLKQRVPIWKKEFFADGEVWVEGEWDSSVLPR
ncbi:MAG: molybdenum cofactor biosynthesis protein MoaE [Bryobacterales bacterium]|nr:molybdenum cofactor biosynthesis protein MoaE [Bryobacterales bacterium]